MRFVRKRGQLACLLFGALLLGLGPHLPAVAANLPPPSEAKNTVLLFVSTSLPPASLVALLRDARKIEAPVLLQGLVDDSFKATFARIHDLVQQAGGGGLSIDPAAFEKYSIDTVPTVVVVGASSDGFDKLAGDIPLLAALKWLRDHGDGAAALTHAITVLEKGEAFHE